MVTPLEVPAPPDRRRGSVERRRQPRERWRTVTSVFIVLLGFAVTAAVGHSLSKPRGAYWSQYELRLLVPKNTLYPNTFVAHDSNLIRAAGVVAKFIDPGYEPLGGVTDWTIPLPVQGVPDGQAVFLPSNGGQWAVNFNDPVIEVKASGPSADVVRQKMTDLTNRVESTLQDLEESAGVDPHNLIVVQPSPPIPVMNYSHGSPSRVLLGTAALGLLATLSAVGLVRRYPRPRPLQGEPDSAS